RPRQPRHSHGHLVDGPHRRLLDHRRHPDPRARVGLARPKLPCQARMDEPPKNLKTMLSEAKDTSELMVDLAYAALYYNAHGIAGELGRLEARLSAWTIDMRALFR